MKDASKFRKLYWESDDLFNRIIEKSGLSGAEFLTLYCLEYGAKTQAEICKQLFMPKQTINSAVKSLSARGFVTLVSSEENAKIKILKITADGKEFSKNHVLVMDDVEDEMWQKFSDDEQNTLLELTKKYNVLLKAKVEKFLSARN